MDLRRQLKYFKKLSSKLRKEKRSRGEFDPKRPDSLQDLFY
jgi:hypothetical protein